MGDFTSQSPQADTLRLVAHFHPVKFERFDLRASNLPRPWETARRGAVMRQLVDAFSCLLFTFIALDFKWARSSLISASRKANLAAHSWTFARSPRRVWRGHDRPAVLLALPVQHCSLKILATQATLSSFQASSSCLPGIEATTLREKSSRQFILDFSGRRYISAV